jgi:hypothetical protein
MIGRPLRPSELAIVYGHAERLIALGYKADVPACLADVAFAAFPPGFQEIIVSDMQFLLGNSGESTLQ